MESSSDLNPMSMDIDAARLAVAELKRFAWRQAVEIKQLEEERDEAREAACEIYRDGTSLLSFEEQWPWLKEGSSDE